MPIELITVGSIKEKYLKLAIEDYIKRINRFCTVSEIQIKDVTNKISKEEVLKKEANLIKEKINSKTYLIVLDLDAKQLTSEEFSKKINLKLTSGNPHITFLIGGSYGIDDSIKIMASEKISFSKMTFPHQLFKVILLEQIYRGFKISNGHKYHK